MHRRLVALVLPLAIAVAPSPGAPEAPTGDPELERGVAQVREGAFADAVVTLDGVSRRLVGLGDRPTLLARAYVYLSIAYLGLSQVEAAKATFLEALKADRDVELTPGEFPPRYLAFFKETTKEAEAPPGAGETSPARPAVAEPEAPEKGRSKLGLVLLGAGAAAGAGIALAGGGGGGSAAQENAYVPEPPLQTSYFSDQIGCHDPFDEQGFPVTRPGTIEAVLNWLEADADIQMHLDQTHPVHREELAWSSPTGPRSAILVYNATQTGSYRLSPFWKGSCWSRDHCTCPTATYTIAVKHP